MTEIRSLEDYQEFVNRSSTKRVDDLGLTYAALGLAGESGEVIERIKKIVRDDRKLTTEDIEYLALELGDVLWYVTRLSNLIGVSLVNILLANVNKLESRTEIQK